MARIELKLVGLAVLGLAALCGAPARAQEAAPDPAADTTAPVAGETEGEVASPAEGDPASPATAEPAAAPLCAAATSYKQCRALCREQFPPKPKVETRGETLARERLAVHGWWSLGLGVALLAGGAVTGGVALHLNSELKGECPHGSCPPPRHADLDTRDRLGVTSTILVAGGVAASAVGILVLAVFARPPQDAVEDAPTPVAAFLPAVGPGAAGGAIAWRF